MTLDEYFEKHYGDFECECEWYVDPTPKSWKFYVPSLHVDIVLSENDGEVTELKVSKLPSDRAFRDVVVEELWDNLTDVPLTPLTKQVIDEWFKEKGLTRSLFVSTFRDQVTGKPMYDIAFQYTPAFDRSIWP